MGAVVPLHAYESEIAARWFAGVGGALRLEDGRIARVVFPGVPGPGPGPDARDAMIEIDHDLVRGDIEFHLRASGWFAHGHHRDPAYARVMLQVVERNDLPAAAVPVTNHAGIPILVLQPPNGGEPEASFTPPCVFARSRTGANRGGRSRSQGLHSIDGGNTSPVLPVLERLGERRLRMKAARVQPLLPVFGAGGILYGAILEILGGPANRAAFSALARELPLPALLERAARDSAAERKKALVAELRYAGARRVLRAAGQRPLAAPGRRLELAGHLVHALWPGEGVGWPAAMGPDAPLLRVLQGGGLPRSLAIETAVNAVLPSALAAGAWPESATLTAWHSLPAPATYGRLKRLRAWLDQARPETEPKPFATASRLQGGLLLHADYCAKGMCGRCPLSS